MANPDRKGMEKWQRIALALVLAGLSWFGVQLPARADGVVRGFYFFSADCSHCQAVAKDVLPGIQSRFGAQLELRFFDIREPANLKVLEALEARYGVSNPGVPEAFIGQDVLVGEDAMRTNLAGTIEKYLAAGGVDFPTGDMPVPVAEVSPTAEPTTSAPVMNLVYFYKGGCQECERAKYVLDTLSKQYPSLQVLSLDIAQRADLNEALAERIGLPVSKRLVTPAIFIGDDALVGNEVTLPRLQALLDHYREAGAPPIWQQVQTQAARETIAQRFRSFGPLTVVGAGLIDGINPCAFATVVFFISYLAFLGRRRREILAVGAAFTLGVFLTYLLVGLGALKFVQALAGVSVLGRAIYGLTAVLCIGFAGVSVHDAWQAYHGKPEAMQMRLPRALRQRVHRVIRENGAAPAFVGIALVTGFVVSLIELACTGQVYLPTILFVLGEPQLRLHAISYLVLYNLVFVLPLVVVFVVAALGTSSTRLATVVQRHTGTIKLLTAAVFALLGAWMLTTVL